MTYDDETHYFSHRVEQQKNSMLMEKNEMMVAVEDLTVEKVSQSLIIVFFPTVDCHFNARALIIILTFEGR